MHISQETQIKVSDLYAEYVKQAKQEIAKEAQKNVKYKVGDVVKSLVEGDGRFVGRVKSIEFDVDLPHREYFIVYTCVRLTKALKPYKSREEFHRRQNDLLLY